MAPEPRGRCSRRNLALSRGRGARVRNQRVNPIQVPGSKPRQRGPLEPTACPSAITTGRAYRDGLPTRGHHFARTFPAGSFPARVPLHLDHPPHPAGNVPKLALHREDWRILRLPSLVAFGLSAGMTGSHPARRRRGAGCCALPLRNGGARPPRPEVLVECAMGLRCRGMS